ncbi:hypothetical protein DNTS_005264 [Danionella cerebrum]|uniref:Uncharacterized protein n=1 Tax=Danionella cerebrum TaxID=2873325 RepID=A0A553R8Q2_9TELE|nr:hypothetical protein DNTS_005264 [Danionella translucida]
MLTDGDTLKLNNLLLMFSVVKSFRNIGDHPLALSLHSAEAEVHELPVEAAEGARISCSELTVVCRSKRSLIWGQLNHGCTHCSPAVSRCLPHGFQPAQEKFPPSDLMHNPRVPVTTSSTAHGIWPDSVTLLPILLVCLLWENGRCSTPSASTSLSDSTETVTQTPSTFLSSVTRTELTPDDDDDDDDDVSNDRVVTVNTMEAGGEQTSTAPVHLEKTSGNTTKIVSHKANTASTATKDPDAEKAQIIAIIIIITIILLIVALLAILYFLRKQGRSYSFDLTRVEVTVNDCVSPLMREQSPKENLEYIQEVKSEEALKSNGCAGDTSDQTPADQREQQNRPEENSFSSSTTMTPPLKMLEFNLDLSLTGGEPDSSYLKASEAKSCLPVAGELTDLDVWVWRGGVEIFPEVNPDEKDEDEAPLAARGRCFPAAAEQLELKAESTDTMPPSRRCRSRFYRLKAPLELSTGSCGQ